MKRLCLFVLVLSMAVPWALGASGPEPCSIEGTWYGTNEEGATLMITITRTGAQTYSAVGQSPAGPPDAPGVLGPFFGTQGDLSRTGPGGFESTWMGIWRVDPNIWGFELAALVRYGPVELTGCNTWEASFTTEFLLHNFDQDPFEVGLPPALSFGPFGASYKRLPKYP